VCLHFSANNIPDLVGRWRQSSAGVNTGQCGHWHTQTSPNKTLRNTLRITLLYSCGVKLEPSCLCTHSIRDQYIPEIKPTRTREQAYICSGYNFIYVLHACAAGVYLASVLESLSYECTVLQPCMCACVSVCTCLLLCRTPVMSELLETCRGCRIGPTPPSSASAPACSRRPVSSIAALPAAGVAQ